MPAADPSSESTPWADHVPSLSVPEIRDYTRINAELALLLDAGHRHVRLAGAGGQRLLARGLRGAWKAVVEIEGHAGPELGADLDAPDLIVICTGSALDGAGRGMRRGRLLILGSAGAAAGTFQSGGTLVIVGSAGHRTGLRQSGGLIIVGDSVGRLASERQSGGHLLVLQGSIGPSAGHGRTGGMLVGPTDLREEDRVRLNEERAIFGEMWPSSLLIPPPVE